MHMNGNVSYRAPFVKDGKLTRDAVFKFFEQKYPEPRRRDRHAGAVFTWLVRTASWSVDDSKNQVIVTCGKCGHLANQPCSRLHRRTHYAEAATGNMLVDAESLKQYGHLLLNTKVNKTRSEDLQLLIDHL
jgi:hypothetical protein